MNSAKTNICVTETHPVSFQLWPERRKRDFNF